MLGVSLHSLSILISLSTSCESEGNVQCKVHLKIYIFGPVLPFVGLKVRSLWEAFFLVRFLYQHLNQVASALRSKKEHMYHRFHSRNDCFGRQREAETKQHASNQSTCPHCNELAPSGAASSSFSRRKHLFKHFNKSTKSTKSTLKQFVFLAERQKAAGFAAKHEAIKSHEGWHDKNRFGDAAHRAVHAKKEISRRRRSIETLITWDYPRDLLEPILIILCPWLQHGPNPKVFQEINQKHRDDDRSKTMPTDVIVKQTPV